MVGREGKRIEGKRVSAGRGEGDGVGGEEEDEKRRKSLWQPATHVSTFLRRAENQTQGKN